MKPARAARRGLLGAAVLCMLTLCDAAAASADFPEIWFSPSADAPDYLGLFSPDAPWQQAAEEVRVFSAPGRRLLGAPVVARLPALLSDLSARRIGLEVGLMALLGNGPGGCGYGVDGYGAPHQALADARLLKSYGANVRYFAMAQPLYYGHSYRGRRACHASIEEVARSVAQVVQEVRSIYPDARFGDVEPMGFQDPRWLHDLETWFDAYQAATGRRLAYFRVDVQWQGAWTAELRSLSELLARKHIPLQVIFSGSTGLRTDEAWIGSAVRHFDAYQAASLPRPTVAVVQSLDTLPSRVLPENDPNTLSSLVRVFADRYRDRH